MVGVEVQARLSDSLSRRGVPGAVVGVLCGDAAVLADGWARVQPQQPWESGTLFQMGSVTKLYTATLVMQAVESGDLALDTPVVDVIPGFRVAAGGHERMLVSHLLSHASGLEDATPTRADVGGEDDCRARYLTNLAGVRLSSEPGSRAVYANANYVVLGRILELLYGDVWEVVIARRLLEPAQLLSTFPLATTVGGRPTALGYIPNEGGIPTTPAWGGPRCYASAGSTPCTTMDDLLSFAAIHLSKGVAPCGVSVLSPASVVEMQRMRFDEISYEAPEHLRPCGVGLGWLRFTHVGREWIGHDGGSAGQMTFLRMCPEVGVAFVVYANAGTGFLLFDDVAEQLASDLLEG